MQSHHANMQPSGAIYDVEGALSAGTAIHPFVRLNDRAKPETLVGQGRLLRRWTQDRSALSERATMDVDAINAWQLERVRLLVNHAYATIPFYRRLYSSVGFEPGGVADWNDFRDLPIITKAMLVEAQLEQQVREQLPPTSTVHSARTSGSSGLNFTILQDDESVDYRTTLHMRFYQASIASNYEPAHLRYNVYFAADRYTSLLGQYRSFTVSQDVPVPTLLEHLRRTRPKVLTCFPSYLQRLAAASPRLCDMGIACVITNSERSSVRERERYSDIFGVPVLDEYSSEELSLIATECTERRYHIVEDSAYVETTDLNRDGYGRLVGTSLGNFLMPFIRYDQGDVVRLGSDAASCACGQSHRVLETFHGREDESLIDGPDKVPSATLLGLCDQTLVLAESNIQQYQIVQTGATAITLRVQPIHVDQSITTALLREFLHGLRSLFRHVEVSIDVIVVHDSHSFPTFGSTKRRLIYVDM